MTKWANEDTTRFRKTHVSMKGKSDKHQKHFLEYEVSHQDGKLERWYRKITTPKPEKPVKEKKAKIVRPYKEPYGVPKPRKFNPNHKVPEKSAMRLAKYKRDTHWVARSEEEYKNMHHMD